MLRLTDLREILRYVPRFRDKTFVIALDGAVVDNENFGNLLLDIALLRSLRIGVLLVHGAGHQIRKLAEQTGQTPSNIDGTGVTDGATMEMALSAANRVAHDVLRGLAATDLRGAVSNALVAHPAGILHGIDHQHTGRVERVDTEMLNKLIQDDVIPVIPPLGLDGEGHTFRLNSDAVAVEVARALHAVKLIYLTVHEGIRLMPSRDVRTTTDENGEDEVRLLRQLTVDEAEDILKRRRHEVPQSVVSKLEQGARAARGGVPRVHIIDGRVEEGLLAEVFSNEGIGTLIHTNEYQSIRKAQKKDVRVIFALLRAAMESEELLRRPRAEIDRLVDDFYVFEVDRNPVACAALRHYTEENKAELYCVCVDPAYENQGIGARLVQFAEGQARKLGVAVFFCLSTQAYNYFVHKAGFQPGTPDDLPPGRRERYDKSGRKSQILIKKLN